MAQEIFDSLLKSIERVFPGSRFEVVAEAELAAICGQFPGVPEHYVAFLRHVGWGSLGDGNFMVYSYLSEPGEIFDADAAAELAGIVFWGDNFSGWMLGFDTRDEWRIVGVNSASPRAYPEEARTVAAFIAQRIADRESR